MNLNQLHYFSKLAEVEHYTKAAEELKISAELKSCDWEPREGTWNKAF